MSIQDLRDIWYKVPDYKVNVSTKMRKDIMLSNNLTISVAGKVRNIKFKNLGGGVYEAYLEDKKY